LNIFKLLEFAFLRSAPHVEAMYTCMRAFEEGDCQLLGKIDHVLVSILCMLWLKNILLPVNTAIGDFFVIWSVFFFSEFSVASVQLHQSCNDYLNPDTIPWKEIIASVEQSVTWLLATATCMEEIKVEVSYILKSTQPPRMSNIAKERAFSSEKWEHTHSSHGQV